MSEERIILSEKPEDLPKAVEWGREKQRKILNEKSVQIADVLMEEMTPLILQRKESK
jgi:uncharacterized DUF497 family protein